MTRSALDSPQAARNPAVFAASPATLNEALVFPSTSTFVDQADACRPTIAWGAYFRTIATMHWPIPAIVLGIDPQSVALALATAAAMAVGVVEWVVAYCSAYPQKSGSMCKMATLWPICWSKKRQSPKYRAM